MAEVTQHAGRETDNGRTERILRYAIIGGCLCLCILAIRGRPGTDASDKLRDKRIWELGYRDGCAAGYRQAVIDGNGTTPGVSNEIGMGNLASQANGALRRVREEASTRSAGDRPDELEQHIVRGDN